MMGDQTLFQRADMVEAGWSIVGRCLMCEALPRGRFPTTLSELGDQRSDQYCNRTGDSGECCRRTEIHKSFVIRSSVINYPLRSTGLSGVHNISQAEPHRVFTDSHE
jgi:hypothetical protein